jgi:hypothetical protein
MNARFLINILVSIVIVVSAVYLLFIFFFQKESLLSNTPNVSSSILKSQESGVFKAKYKSINEMLSKRTHLKPIEVWVEKVWQYNEDNRIETQKELQFVIRFINSDVYSDSLKFSSPNASFMGFKNYRLFFKLKDTINKDIKLLLITSRDTINCIFSPAGVSL